MSGLEAEDRANAQRIHAEMVRLIDTIKASKPKTDDTAGAKWWALLTTDLEMTADAWRKEVCV